MLLNQLSLQQIDKSTGKHNRFDSMLIRSTPLIKLIMTWKCKFSVKICTGANYSALVAKTQSLCYFS